MDPQLKSVNRLGLHMEMKSSLKYHIANLDIHKKEDGMGARKDIESWIVYTSNREKFEGWRTMFESLNPICGRMSKTIGKLVFQNSGLSEFEVNMIWKLADLDSDGMLNCHEFCLGMYLIDLHFKGDIELPSELPTYLYPPTLMAKNNQ